MSPLKVLFYPKAAQKPPVLNTESLGCFPSNGPQNHLAQAEISSLIQLVTKHYHTRKPILLLGYGSTMTIQWMYESFPTSFLKKVPIDLLYFGSRKKFEQGTVKPWRHLSLLSMKTIFTDEATPNQLSDLLGQQLSRRTALILTGGNGHPSDEFYQPVLSALKLGLMEGTPMLGSCMAHELIGHLHAQMGYSQVEINSLFFEFGPHVEQLTDQAQKLLLFAKMDSEVLIFHGNEHQVLTPNLKTNVFPHGKVLMRSRSTNLPSAVLWDFTRPNQVITTQGHTEIQLGTSENKLTEMYREILLEDFQEVVPYFLEHYDMKPQDLDRMMDSKYLRPNLGFAFLGRSLFFLLQERDQ